MTLPRQTLRSTAYDLADALDALSEGLHKETASGEPFDMYDLTAAHPTLPLGTHVKVTNLRNGKTVIVRVNDRGPVVEGRIIDLSYEAARVLNLDHQGIQTVRLDLVSEPQTVAMLRPVARLQ